jgi:cell wall-associated NlpC family hydrolase
VATPRPALGHALDQIDSDRPLAFRRPTLPRRLGRGIVVGATATLTLTLLPGIAAAEPEQASSAAQAAQLAAQANLDLGEVTEDVNEARETLAQQQAAAAAAGQAAVEARQQLGALDGQIRQVARTAFTGDGMTDLHLLMSSDSIEDFVSQLATLDAIAGHTNDVLTQVAETAAAAEQAQQQADAAQAGAQRALGEVTAKQTQLEADIADYQAQYAALSAQQQEEVQQAEAAHVGQAVVSPAPVAATSGSAQAAVDTALVQVGDPYVWGAVGPNAFDCSGLIQYAYAAAGISLPHSSRMQSTMGSPVSRADLQPGDLVFYFSPVSHVALYIGNGQMVHAATSGQPVKVVSIDSMGGITAMRRIS